MREGSRFSRLLFSTLFLQKYWVSLPLSRVFFLRIKTMKTIVKAQFISIHFSLWIHKIINLSYNKSFRFIFVIDQVFVTIFLRRHRGGSFDGSQGEWRGGVERRSERGRILRHFVAFSEFLFNPIQFTASRTPRGPFCCFGFFLLFQFRDVIRFVFYLLFFPDFIVVLTITNSASLFSVGSPAIFCFDSQNVFTPALRFTLYGLCLRQKRSFIDQ